MVDQVLPGAIGMVVLGLGIGILAALALGGVLESQLYGVSRHDPATPVGVSVMLVLVALLLRPGRLMAP